MPHRKDEFPSLYTARKTQILRARRKELVHRPKNGIYDPITFFHVLDCLLEMKPGTLFTTREFVDGELRGHSQALAWDTVTVGRVIADMAESLHEANGTHPIEAVRRWNGMLYGVSKELEDRIAMENLLDDLATLSEEVTRLESESLPVTRGHSPMNDCPSVMSPLADRAG